MQSRGEGRETSGRGGEGQCEEEWKTKNEEERSQEGEGIDICVGMNVYGCVGADVL